MKSYGTFNTFSNLEIVFECWYNITALCVYYYKYFPKFEKLKEETCLDLT